MISDIYIEAWTSPEFWGAMALVFVPLALAAVALGLIASREEH